MGIFWPKFLVKKKGILVVMCKLNSPGGRGVAQQKHYKSRLKIIPRSSYKALAINDSTNDVDFTNVSKIRKLESWIRKPWGNDIKWYNIWGDQTTHFISSTKNLTANNSSCNYKNAKITFDVGPTICVSFAKKRKTQIGWAATIGRKTRRWAKVNNTSRNGSLCHVPSSDKMIMRSPCQETW
jgi:hypothetical protein